MAEIRPPSSSIAQPVLPLSSSTTLPPPSALSSDRSSSSSRKRTYSEAIASRTELFTHSVKERIKGRYDRCWLCGARPVEVCHIIARKDTTFAQLKASGLVSFEELGDEENATGLCPTCHRNFDAPFDPGFVFLPEDLDFFIRFEKADQTRRQKAKSEHGIELNRLVPTPERYMLEQEREGGIDSGAVGGQYRRYILQDFLPQGLHQNLHNSLRGWHGSPTAAIQRGIRIVGHSPPGIPPNIRQQLRDLLALYEWDFGPKPTNNFPSLFDPASPDEDPDPADRQKSPKKQSQTRGGTLQREGDDRGLTVMQSEEHEERVMKRKRSKSGEPQEQRPCKLGRQLSPRNCPKGSRPPGPPTHSSGSKNEDTRPHGEGAAVKLTWGCHNTSNDVIRFFTAASQEPQVVQI